MVCEHSGLHGSLGPSWVLIIITCVLLHMPPRFRPQRTIFVDAIPGSKDDITYSTAMQNGMNSVRSATTAAVPVNFRSLSDVFFFFFLRFVCSGVCSLRFCFCFFVFVFVFPIVMQTVCCRSSPVGDCLRVDRGFQRLGWPGLKVGGAAPSRNSA